MYFSYPFFSSDIAHSAASYIKSIEWFRNFSRDLIYSFFPLFPIAYIIFLRNLVDPSLFIAVPLKNFLNSVSEKHDVAQKLIASTQDLEDLIADDNADIKTLKGWRYNLFGKKAIEFKNGKIAIIMNDNNIELKEI